MTSIDSGLDEDELLGGAAETTVALSEDYDEDALLMGVSRTTTTEFEQVLETDHRGEDKESRHDIDREELDYDEDDEDYKEERTSRFASERNTTQTSSSNSGTSITSSVTSQPSAAGQAPIKKTWTTSSSRGFTNNGGRGNYSNMNGARGNYNNMNMVNRGRGGFSSRGGPPPLMALRPMPPPLHLMGHGPPGGKILVNPNFVPPSHGPQIRLNMQGNPTIFMGGGPSAMSMLGGPVGPIVPRLPNGIPLTGLPPNHGVAGFGSPPPGMRPMGRGGPGMPPMGGPAGGQWDQAVAAFLSQPPAGQPVKASRRRRSSSYSSGSSYSSRSRSSGSRSRSPRRRSDKRGDRKDGKRTRGSNGSRNPNRQTYAQRPRTERDRRDDKQVTADCAKAVGVDSEYLSRLEDQKRKRDDIIKKKEQRRLGHDEKPSSTKSTEKAPAEKKPSSSSEGPTSDPSKKKAYLCVTVKNLKQLPTAKTRIETLAKEIGKIRKCWQLNDDQVNVIFIEHEKAKAFMVKYNNKVLSGLRVTIGLEKDYLNLADLR